MGFGSAWAHKRALQAEHKNQMTLDCLESTLVRLPQGAGYVWRDIG